MRQRKLRTLAYDFYQSAAWHPYQAIMQNMAFHTAPIITACACMLPRLLPVFFLFLFLLSLFCLTRLMPGEFDVITLSL